MKLVRMETQEISKPSCPALTNSDKLFETSAEIKDETKVKIHCHFQKNCSHPVLLSHLTYNEIPMEFSTGIASLYADGKSKENQNDGELLYPSDCNGVGDQTRSPSHLLPKSSSDERPVRNHEINLIKKKQNTGSCSDIQLSSPRNNSVFQIDEMTNIDVSSSEDQENEEDEDIFKELPVNERVLESMHKTFLFQARGDRYHRISDKCNVPPVIGCSDRNQRTLKEYKMHVQAHSIKEGEYSESMLHLMKKLEQLNLDIEEALSIGSSPSGTPHTKRHKQMLKEPRKNSSRRATSPLPTGEINLQLDAVSEAG